MAIDRSFIAAEERCINENGFRTWSLRSRNSRGQTEAALFMTCMGHWNSIYARIAAPAEIRAGIELQSVPRSFSKGSRNATTQTTFFSESTSVNFRRNLGIVYGMCGFTCPLSSSFLVHASRLERVISEEFGSFTKRQIGTGLRCTDPHCRLRRQGLFPESNLVFAIILDQELINMPRRFCGIWLWVEFT